MSAFLLDVNLLIALVWPAHEFHASAQRWFARSAQHGWATCPFTEAALVRLLSNPAFSRDAVTPQEAIKILSVNLAHRHHRFWGDEIGFAEAVKTFRQRLVGHRQVSDAYCLALPSTTTVVWRRWTGGCSPCSPTTTRIACGWI